MEEVNNKMLNIIVENSFQIEDKTASVEGPTNKGVRCHSFLKPSGNRIQNLELLQDWIGTNLVCGFCKQGSPTMIKEMDMEGLSSKILWQCSACKKEFLASTSPKVKFTNEKGEKPKSTVNLMAVGGAVMGGSTFRTLETMLGSMDIPC